MMRIGVGYRPQLVPWLGGLPKSVTCIELTAEHFYGTPERMAAVSFWRRQSGNIPCYLHGLGLSLGTPGALDQGRLAQFSLVAQACEAEWISEHIAFTRTSELDLGHLNPVPPTRASIKTIAAHAIELSDRCNKPLLLENITSHVQLPGEMSEPEFLNQVCEQGRCGLLLDVTNLFVNSRNHRFDPVRWLHELEPKYVRQLHIVGYSINKGRFMDDHATPIQQELLDLAGEVLRFAPAVESIILERDLEIPGDAQMDIELAKLESLSARN